MSKQHKIRWTQTDTQELTRVVRNFNSKVRRLAKKNPQLKNALPPEVKVKQLKELINTRQDLKRELNALKRFSKRGAEEIVVIDNTDYNLTMTKWQRTEMNRRVGFINKKRKKRLQELQEIELTQDGEELGYKLGDIGMGKANEVSLQPMNAFTRRMSQYDLKWKWKAIMTESQSDYYDKKDMQLRDNFIKAIEENFGSRASDVVDSIKDMDIGDFLTTFRSEGNTLEFAYPPDDEQADAYITKLRSDYKKKLIKTEEINLDK